ncbi:2-oxoglutarate and iron-dependent oxygenase domain-containing protein [Candidatus Pantoea persica]|uniref:2-oxoglutarate and iron-dependent oxygenase domain-containing protein n=1 Tax=Candidatus Pantoea persica TaxID=2518128 RepID=UPI00215DB934|nr:2-oxoglutarate and iron-dependent oxygenase domain-containing protein [Candidatus Pantoea persica]MBA2815880.1 2-oxobutyrate oxidase [Candidatus Pantoea persica]
MIWTSLPVLDLAQLAGIETEQTDFLTRLRESVRDVDFFYLINHDINPQLQQNVQSITRAFF